MISFETTGAGGSAHWKGQRRYGRCACDDRLGRSACNRRERPRRRSGRGYDGVRSGPRARGGRLELDDRALRHPDARHHPAARSSRSCSARVGIDNKTTIILYGDNNNWFAAWAFWQLKMYGHEDVRIMDGGRKKWLAEGRELTHRQAERSPRRPTRRAAPDLSLRAFLPEVQQASAAQEGGARRRPQPRGVHRRDPRAARAARNAASAAATSRARRAFPGARPATRTARSRASTS